MERLKELQEIGEKQSRSAKPPKRQVHHHEFCLPGSPQGAESSEQCRLCIPQCCSQATQLQCGKGLSTLEKAFPYQHCVKPPAFHLSSDCHGVRRGKGKDDMKRM